MSLRVVAIGCLALGIAFVGCIDAAEDATSQRGCGVSDEGDPGIQVPIDSTSRAPHETHFKGGDACLRIVGVMEGTAQTTSVGIYRSAPDVDTGPVNYRVMLENVTGTWSSGEGESVEWTNHTVTVEHLLELGATLHFRQNGTHFLDTVDDSVGLGSGKGSTRIPLDVAQPGPVHNVPGPSGENGTLTLEGLEAVSVEDGWVRAEDLDLTFSEVRRIVTIRPEGTWRVDGEPIEPGYQWMGSGRGVFSDGIVEFEFEAVQSVAPGGWPLFGFDLDITPSPDSPIEMRAEEGLWANQQFTVTEVSHNAQADAQAVLADVPEDLEQANVCTGRHADGVCYVGRGGLDVSPGGRQPVLVSVLTDAPPGRYSLELVIQDPRSTYAEVPLEVVVEE